MTSEGGGQEVTSQCQVISIIQNEQPVRVPLEPQLDGSDDPSTYLLALFRQVGQRSNGKIGGGEGVVGIGLCPQHGLVISSMAIGILQGDLRLANASQPGDGVWLGERCCLASEQLGTQTHEQLLPAREERIAWEMC